MFSLPQQVEFIPRKRLFLLGDCHPWYGSNAKQCPHQGKQVFICAAATLRHKRAWHIICWLTWTHPSRRGQVCTWQLVRTALAWHACMRRHLVSSHQCLPASRAASSCPHADPNSAQLAYQCNLQAANRTPPIPPAAGRCRSCRPCMDGLSRQTIDPLASRSAGSACDLVPSGKGLCSSVRRWRAWTAPLRRWSR